MNRHKRIMALLLLVSALAARPAVPSAAAPEEAQNEVRLKKRQFAVQDSLREREMRLRLAELESKLQSEKIMHDQQAKLALEYAERVQEIQRAAQELKTVKEESLVKMQEKLRREMEMANLYNKERLLRIIDEKYHEDNAKIAELEETCYKLAVLHKESKEADKKRGIEAELKNAINDLFELREAARERDMKQLETDLTQMKEMLSQRRANKSQIVQKRLDQLLGKKDDLDW
jgi:hypothetical protein